MFEILYDLIFEGLFRLILFLVKLMFKPLILLFRKLTGGKKTSAARAVTSAAEPARQAPAPAGRLQPIETYPQTDPAFSASAFTEKLSNLYVQLQDAVHAKDLSGLRPYLGDALFGRINGFLEQQRGFGVVTHIERIAVQGVTLVGWREEGQCDVITAKLRTRVTEYTVEEASGRPVSGDPAKECFLENEWTLTRSVGSRGKPSGIQTVRNCPHCGAPLNVSRTAKCAYCDSVITADDSDWVIAEIRELSRRV